MRKHKLGLIRISVSIIMVIIINFLCNQLFAATNYIDKLSQLTKPIEAVNEKAKPDRTIFEEMIETFCKNMTDGDPMLYGSGTYSAKNSLFMYRLCNDGSPDINTDIKRGDGLSNNDGTAYTKFEENSNGEMVEILKEKLPDSYKNTAKYMDELFNTIIESYTNIYQASIYGAIGGEKEDQKKLIEEFSKSYFGYGKNEFISICATDKNPVYPKTCKKVKSYLSKAKNNLKSSNNILNVDNLYKARETSNCIVDNKKYNTIICGLYKNDLRNFINLVYNELFFYTSFAQYYSFILDAQSSFKAGDIKDQQQQEDRKQKEIAVINQNISDSRQAISISVRMIKELQMTFPVHIGMLMYTEAINTFTFNFNKTLVPIYTIGDLFRNVQDTK